MVLTVEAESCSAVLPFQFYMLSRPDSGDFPFLPRPISVYDASERSLDFLVKVVGKGTASLADLRLGDELQLTGPLGNGVSALDPARRLVGVAGGVGIAPFLLLFRRLAAGLLPAGTEKPALVFGARTKEFLYDLDLFQELPVEIRIATEDGSLGKRGLVTDLLKDVLSAAPCEVLTCGPDRMMAEVAVLCEKSNVPCRVSLETYMACGIGVCNCCAVKVADERYRGGYRYDRCCVNGPVFDAAAIESL
ncbi:MAG: dihydroorotate dehydrogenase electron transfer subunit [Planctomycetota bacterium]